MSKNYAPLTIENAKSKLLANKNRRLEIDIPEWECSLFIKPITLIQKMELSEMGKSGDPNINIKISCKALHYSLIDEQGNPLFTEEEIMELLDNSSTIIEPVVNKILEFNGMTQESIKEIENNFLSPNIDSPIS